MHKWRDEIRERLAGLSLSPAREAEIVEELTQHLDQRCEELMADGASEDEARHAAFVELNSRITLAEHMQPLQQARVPPAEPPHSRSTRLTGLHHDLRLAFRVLRSTPVVSVAAVFSLALGIGANTAIFSIADSLLVRPLPVTRPDQLAVLRAQPAGATVAQSSWSNPVWEEISSRRHALFETAFAYSARVSRFNLSPTGQADLVDGIFVSGDYFNGLGVPAVLGRTLIPVDDQRGGGTDGAVTVISYGLWQRRYGGAADVVGRRLTIDRTPFTIVGVLPAGFFGADVGSSFDIAMPLGTEPLVRGRDSFLDKATTSWLVIMARLRDGQDPSQAQSEVQALLPRARNPSAPVTLESAAVGTSGMRARYRRPLLILLSVVGVVLLIACANLANLQSARVVGRRHEFSVRLAIGASRWRLTRQLIVESLVLASLGASLGLAFAWWMSRVLVQQLSTFANTVYLAVPLDGRVIGFAAALTVVTAVVFGTWPAWLSCRAEPTGALRAHGRGIAGGGRRASAVLVGTQVALSLVLVITAGLLLTTFASVLTRDLGFDRERVLLAQLDLRNTSVAPKDRSAFYAEVAKQVASMTGVANAAVSDTTPVSGSVVDNYIEVENGPTSNQDQHIAFQNVVTSDWFDTYGTRIAMGRDFDRRDHPGAAPVVIVNETFVRRFMGPGTPLGRRVRRGAPGEQGPWLEVVGVVVDAAYRSVRDPLPPTFYLPLSQVKEPPAMMRLNVRVAAGPSGALAQTIAAGINSRDPSIVMTFSSLQQQVDAALVQERLLAMLSVFFGGLAVVLAAVGLYGTCWHTVNRQRRELGIRLALGASPAKVRRFVLSRAGLLVATGIAAGLVVSLWTSTLLTTLLYRVEPFDLRIVASAIVVLVGVGLLAAWLPASRASRIDPSEVLRDS